MASWSKYVASSTLSSIYPARCLPCISNPASSVPLFLPSKCHSTVVNLKHSSSTPCGFTQKAKQNFICRAAEYKFPDPIPEFADAETEKFRTHLLTRLSKRDVYGDSLDEVVEICTEIFSTFVHSEYGGPGTLLITPFIDMADTLSERGLPGGPQAARTAVKWAHDHVDNDWNEWNHTSDTPGKRGLSKGRSSVKLAQNYVDKDWKD